MKKATQKERKKVLMVLLNPFKNDSRVLKEGISVSKEYNLTLVAIHKHGLPKYEKINDNFQVHRVKAFLHGVNIIGKLIYPLFFLIGIFKFRSHDVIHCHDLNGLIIGVLLKWSNFNKNKLIYDAHEYETERIAVANSMFKKKITLYLERIFIQSADKIITVSNAIADEYVRLYDIDKPALVLNCPPYFKNVPHKDLFRKAFNISEDQTVFLYQGGLMEGRGIDMILDAFKKINDQDKVIVFMGYGALGNKIKQASKDYRNIFYHDAVSPNIVLDYTASADMGILFYENICLNHYYCSPNKFFEYTQAGLPVIISNMYEIRGIVNEFNNGIAVEENVEALQDAIENLTIIEIKKYKKNIEEMKKIYCWEKQEKILLDLYKNLG